MPRDLAVGWRGNVPGFVGSDGRRLNESNFKETEGPLGITFTLEADSYLNEAYTMESGIDVTGIVYAYSRS